MIKTANPRGNALLNSRLIYLRLKVRFNMMKPRSTLFNMKVETIDTPYCLFCLNDEPLPRIETMNHIFFKCDAMKRVWENFRRTVGDEWGEEVDEISIVVGSRGSGWGSKKVEFVLLSLINRLWGIRSDGGADPDKLEKMLQKTIVDAVKFASAVEEWFVKPNMKLQNLGNVLKGGGRGGGKCSFPFVSPLNV